MNDAHDKELQAIRESVRSAKKVATTLGYGPRFLHSTGQLHKGGPNSGVFLQITSGRRRGPGDSRREVHLRRAQGRAGAGRFQVLSDRGRRILRVHLGKDVAAGLAKLREIVQKSL